MSFNVVTTLLVVIPRDAMELQASRLTTGTRSLRAHQRSDSVTSGLTNPIFPNAVHCIEKRFMHII